MLELMAGVVVSADVFGVVVREPLTGAVVSADVCGAVLVDVC